MFGPAVENLRCLCVVAQRPLAPFRYRGCYRLMAAFEPCIVAQLFFFLAASLMVVLELILFDQSVLKVMRRSFPPVNSTPIRALKKSNGVATCGGGVSFEVALRWVLRR